MVASVQESRFLASLGMTGLFVCGKKIGSSPNDGVVKSAKWGTLLQDGFDFVDGDGAFAEDFPVFVLDADDRGGEAGTGFAGVENEREAQAELLHQLIGVGAGREAGDVRAGAGDGAAELVDELFDDGMFGPAQCDF